MSSKLDLTMYQGDNYQHRFTWLNFLQVPIDLTGYSAQMQVRPSPSSDTVIFHSTSDNGDITLGGAAGTIDLNIPTEKTSLLPVKNQSYDMELTSPAGVVTTLVYGAVSVLAEVTR